MTYLTARQILELHRMGIARSGGSSGVRDLKAVEAAAAQPEMTFDGDDLYPTLTAKAGTLAFSLIQNHPFVDGDKRGGHAAVETMLLLNDYEIDAPVDEQERVILAVASSQLSRAALTEWLEQHLIQNLQGPPS
jgi:death on curing protein